MENNINTETNAAMETGLIDSDSNYMVAGREEEVVTVGLLEEMKNTKLSIYCSMENDGKRDTQVTIYNAINNCDTPLSAQQNLTLEVIDIAAYPVQLYDKETGEIFESLRIIFICKNGETYFATSQGILNSVRKIFMTVGMPDGGAWHKNPVKIKVLRKRTRSEQERYVNILELVK